MDNLNQPQTRKDLIKRLVLMLLGVLVFSLLLAFITFGRIPVKGLLISLALVLPLMIISAIWGFKNQSKIRTHKNKFFYVYIILGTFSMVIELLLVFIEGRGLNHYIGIAGGAAFIYYGFKKLNKK